MKFEGDGDLMFGMDGMLVDAGKIISFDLFDCGPLLLELFRHDDLNSSKLNSGKAAADVSVVNLKIKIKKIYRKFFESPLVRNSLCILAHRVQLFQPCPMLHLNCSHNFFDHCHNGIELAESESILNAQRNQKRYNFRRHDFLRHA